MDIASFIVGMIGNVITLVLFASPIKTFWWIVKNKSTQDYEGLPYILTLMSSSVWTFYGILRPHGLLVATVNGAGSFFQIIFVILFVIYAPFDKKIKSVKLIVIVNIGFVGAVISTALLAVEKSKRLSYVGIAAVLVAIIMYASPLSIMRTVIKTKSVEYMPFYLSLFQCLTGGIWTIFGVLIQDVFIGVANGVGFFLASVQLVLYAVYKNKSSLQNSDKAMEVGPTDTKMRSQSRTPMIRNSILLRASDRDVENGNPHNAQV